MHRRERGMGRRGGYRRGWMGSRMRGHCPHCGREVEMDVEEGPYRGRGPAKPDDAQIKDEVERILTEDPWLDASDFQVSVDSGIVTLTGSVESRMEKKRAEDDVDMALGVRDVQNGLEIKNL